MSIPGQPDDESADGDEEMETSGATELLSAELRREPVLDRHDMFASTVPLAGARVGVQRTPLPPLRTLLPSSSVVQSQASITLSQDVSCTWCSSSPSAGVASRATARSGRSCGVPIRLDAIPRGETLPDRNSGKRSHCAGDRLIRIFVRLPGNGRLALWVDPDLPVGPMPRPPLDAFTRTWGEDAELRGPYSSRRSAEDGRRSPLRELLARRGSVGNGLGIGGPGLPPLGLASLAAGLGSGAQSAGPASQNSVGELLPSAGCSAVCAAPESSLKGLLEVSTGVPVARQRVVFGTMGPLDDDAKLLCDYNVGHGALLHLSLRTEQREKKGPDFLASPLLAQVRGTDAIRTRLGQYARNRAGKKWGREIDNVLPDWKQPHPAPPKVEWPEELSYYDYSVLRDNTIFDLTGRIRKRFAQMSRMAVANKPQTQIEAVLPPHTAR